MSMKPPTGGPGQRSRDNWVGRVVDERYAVHELVAENGVARVYRASDTLAGTRVALKRLYSPELDARFLVRFRSALYRVARLKLPRLVAVRDYGLIEGEAVVAMDWMSAPTLRDHLALRGRLRAAMTSQFGLWMAEALADLHRRDILHLGLTPGNVFLDAVVGARLSDVGLARAVADTGLTLTGADIGHALPYLAPEQLTYRELTPAADVYALGVVLFHTITGRLPHVDVTLADRMASQRARASEAPPRPSKLVRGVPVALDDTVALCLHPDPQVRPASGVEVAARLRARTSETSKIPVAYIERATQAHRALSRQLPAMSIHDRKTEIQRTRGARRNSFFARRAPRE